MTAVVIIALAVLFFLGAPVFAVILAGAAYGASVLARGESGFIADFGNQISAIVELATGDQATTLSTIPLFIFAGFVMAQANTAARVVRASRAAFGMLPGGLAVVTVFACSLFTIFTGASGVTIVALGGLLLPSLVKEHYPERFSLGLVTGTGSVGLLFPPALPLFVYGTVYGAVSSLLEHPGAADFSTDRFIFAGIVPGLVLLALLSAYAVLVARKNRVPRQAFCARELVDSWLRAMPEMLLPAIILGGILLGLSHPEVAALGALYVLVLEIAVFRDLKVSKLGSVAANSMALVGAIFVIIFAAQALTNFFATAEVPALLFDWITSTFDSKWTFLLALNLFLLVVGMAIDIFSAIIIVVPLITGVAMAYGVDPYHLGVIFLLNLELGYITPPVGLNLFIAAFTFKKPVGQVVVATVPFLVCMIFALGIVTYVPALTVVPPAKRRGRVAIIANDLAAEFKLNTAVPQIDLPDGGTLTMAHCQGKENAGDREACIGVLVDVGHCRQMQPAEAAQSCEREAIASYVDLNPADDDDWGDLDDEGQDENGDEDEDGLSPEGYR